MSLRPENSDVKKKKKKSVFQSLIEIIQHFGKSQFA